MGVCFLSKVHQTIPAGRRTMTLEQVGAVRKVTDVKPALRRRRGQHARRLAAPPFRQPYNCLQLRRT
jgi:hypothetical protein